MSGEMGASAAPTGLVPTVEPASGLAGSAASIPSAGEWAVVRRRSYFSYYSHEPAQIDAVKPKTVLAKVGYGRRLQRVSIDDLVVVSDEAAAKLLCARLESAKAEAIERERKARDDYKARIAKLYASAIEARRAETGTGSVHESAAPKADATNLPSGASS